MYMLNADSKLSGTQKSGLNFPTQSHPDTKLISLLVLANIIKFMPGKLDIKKTSSQGSLYLGNDKIYTECVTAFQTECLLHKILN